MIIGKGATQQPLPEDKQISLAVKGHPIKHLSQSSNILVTITPDHAKTDRELSIRTGKAEGAFNQLNIICKNKFISLGNKIRIFTAAVITVLNYGCEIWNTDSGQEGRLESFHQHCFRRILKVRWFHKVRKEEVPQELV